MSDTFNKMFRLLDSSVGQISQHFFDDFVEEHVDRFHESGLRTLVIRRQIGQCCSWCAGLVGIYEYDNLPNNIYRRHRDCKCLVTFKNEKGYQDVWSKKDYETQEQARRKRIEEIEEQEIKKRKSATVRQEKNNYAKEYLKRATPGEGKIKIANNYKPVDDHVDRMDIKDWLHDALGGDIEVLGESGKDGIKMPDFRWREEGWELKTISSEKAANSAVRKGLQQILSQENPGGIILYFREYIPDMRELEETVDKRMRWYELNGKQVDIMIVVRHTLVEVLRYN